MSEALAWFPATYEGSTARFRSGLARVQELWPDARLRSHRLPGDDELTIDWFEAEALETKDNVLILTSGQHGVEAYVGAAVLQLFSEALLPRLDARTTGLLVVHAINPWGMKHRRRTNAANVDLNRNFLADPADFDPAFNPDYARLEPFLSPQGPIRSLGWSTWAFHCGLVRHLVSLGPGRLNQAVLSGQYRFPKGIYYGGAELQEETRVVMDLLRRHIEPYGQVVHLDMHTGWGPRYQMSLVTSPQEPRDSGELQRLFDYPQVVKADPSEFYSMRGDMIDYVYTLAAAELASRRLFAASFEFGTFGDSALADIRGLHAEVFENRLHWYGATSARARERIGQRFEALNAPQSPRWRLKALADARQAFEGVLRAEGSLAP